MFFFLIFCFMFFLISLYRKKQTQILSSILLVLFLIFNTDNNDYETYKMIFANNNSSGLAEVGFEILIKIVKFFGGNDYRIILIILGILILFTLFRYRKHIMNLSFVIFLYFVFPFVLDIVQIRATFMFFLVLNALLEYSNKNKIRTLILLLLAASFHNLGWIYLFVFLMIQFFTRSNKVILLPVISKNNLFFYIIILYFGSLNLLFGEKIIEFIIKYSPFQRISTKLELYMTDSFNIDSLIGWGLILILDLIIFYFMINKKKFLFDKNEYILINTLYLTLFFGIIMIGNLIYLFEISRFFRNLFIIKYILYGILDKYLNSNEKILFRTYFTIVSTIFLFIYYWRGFNYNGIIKNNIIFNFLF